MKQIASLIAGLLALPSALLAGGNSSVAEIDNITKIEIGERKITITGSGVLRFRLMTVPEKKDGNVFGKPFQWTFSKVDDCTFEIVPYKSNHNGSGAPEGRAAAINETSEKWWKDTLEKAKSLKIGDAAVIGYQGDVKTTKGYQVARIIGQGSLRKKEKPDGAAK